MGPPVFSTLASPLRLFHQGPDPVVSGSGFRKTLGPTQPGSFTSLGEFRSPCLTTTDAVLALALHAVLPASPRWPSCVPLPYVDPDVLQGLLLKTLGLKSGTFSLLYSSIYSTFAFSVSAGIATVVHQDPKHRKLIVSPGSSVSRSRRLMLKLKLQYFSHLMRRADSLEKTLMLGGIGGWRRRGQQRMRWLDGITWVWLNSRSWWCWPGVLQSMGSQRGGHGWATELNWTELNKSLKSARSVWEVSFKCNLFFPRKDSWHGKWTHREESPPCFPGNGQVHDGSRGQGRTPYSRFKAITCHGSEVPQNENVQDTPMWEHAFITCLKNKNISLINTDFYIFCTHLTRINKSSFIKQLILDSCPCVE